VLNDDLHFPRIDLNLNASHARGQIGRATTQEPPWADLEAHSTKVEDRKSIAFVSIDCGVVALILNVTDHFTHPTRPVHYSSNIMYTPTPKPNQIR
jgi:hypothetical protein